MPELTPKLIEQTYGVVIPDERPPVAVGDDVLLHLNGWPVPLSPGATVTPACWCSCSPHDNPHEHRPEKYCPVRPRPPRGCWCLNWEVGKPHPYEYLPGDRRSCPEQRVAWSVRREPQENVTEGVWTVRDPGGSARVGWWDYYPEAARLARFAAHAEARRAS